MTEHATALPGPDSFVSYTSGDPGYVNGRAAAVFVGVQAWGDLRPDGLYKHAERKLEPYRPDFVVRTAPVAVHAGYVHSFSGGLGMSMPVAHNTVEVWGFRYKPARMGANWDRETLMVTVISNPALYEMGLLEGDTLVSVGGVPLPKSGDPHHAFDVASLKWQPGETVEVIWIRPGEGRKSGSFVLLPND